MRTKKINRLSSKGTSRALDNAVKLRSIYKDVLNNRSSVKTLGTIQLAKYGISMLNGAALIGTSAFAAGGPFVGLLGASASAVATHAIYSPMMFTTPNEVPLTSLSKKAIKKYEKENKQ